MFDNEQQFYCSFSQVLIKADEKDPNVVYLEASNEKADNDGEIVLQKALEDDVQSFLKSGVISYDHQHKLQKDPSYIIGEPQDVSFKKDGTTLIKGRLYPHVKYAASVLGMLKDGTTRLGASIGGALMMKSKAFIDKVGKVMPVVSKIKWDEVAITYKPVNKMTTGRVSLMPMAAFGKSFEFSKALMAGAGVNAANFTGGRALVPESLMGHTVKMLMADKNFWSEVIAGIHDGIILDMSSLKDFVSKRGISDSNDINVIAEIVIKNKEKLKF